MSADIIDFAAAKYKRDLEKHLVQVPIPGGGSLPVYVYDGVDDLSETELKQFFEELQGCFRE